MSTMQSTETDQRQFWQMVLETRQSSGLSVRQFCKQEGLSEASFYAWRKRLSQEPAMKATPVDGRCEEDRAEPFIQVSLPHASWPGVELLLSSGHTLRIPVGVDRQTLTAVLSALGEAGLC